MANVHVTAYLGEVVIVVALEFGHEAVVSFLSDMFVERCFRCVSLSRFRHFDCLFRILLWYPMIGVELCGLIWLLFG